MFAMQSGRSRVTRWSVWCVPLVLIAGQSAFGEIRWKSGPVQALPMSPESIEQVISGLSAGGAGRHMVVTFDRPVDDALRGQLRASGLTLLNYLGDNAFFAAVAPQGTDASALASVAALNSAQPIARAWKLAPRLLAGQPPEWSIVDNADPLNPTVGAYVLFHPDVALNPDGADVAVRHAATIRSQLESINGLVIELPLADVAALADEDAVQWIEPPLPRLSVVNNDARARVGADTVQQPPYGLDGTGVTVLVYDAGTARSTHVDFGGRASVHDGSGQNYHSTHVAGTIGGSGAASGGTYKGMAPNVAILSYGFEYDGSGIFLYSNPGDIEDDYDEAINTFGADISNNSIGTNTATNGFPCDITGDYGVTANLIDSIVRGSLGEPFRIVWANGNERQTTRCGDTYFTTAPPACAKNHITVGAMNSNDDSVTSFTSWGPTDDGRMKPDVSAPGCQSNDDFGLTSTDDASDTAYYTLCGTSMASPTTCGVSALILQDYRSEFPGQPDFRNSTLKILLAHTAEDIQNPGPDYQTGYGSIRVQPAIDFLRMHSFLEDEVSQGATFSVEVTVDPGDPELKVTLAWDDYPATPNADPALVNDLDLRVFDPSMTRHYPWTLDPGNPSANAVRTQEDHVNNIEQVYVASPAAGTWTIEVVGYNVPQGPQPFSLAATPQLEVTALLIGLPDSTPDLLQPGTITPINVQIRAINDTYVDGSGLLHYRMTGGSFVTAPLTHTGGEFYQANLPAAHCDHTPEFYFSAEGTTSGVVTNPADAPASFYSADVGEIITLVDDDFETASGWTVGDTGDDATTGIWNRMDPEGTAAQPEDDHTADPGTICWVTDGNAGGSLGDYDVDGGKTTLMSPTMDLSGSADAVIGYWRWYSNNTGADPNNDVFVVDISDDDGGSWVNVETVGPSGAGTSGGWFYHEFLLTDFVAASSTVKMRFIASDEATGSLVEAAVDDFQITVFQCDYEPPDCPGDLNGDSYRNVSDFTLFVAAYGSKLGDGNYNPDADMNSDGFVNVADFSQFATVYGVPCP